MWDADAHRIALIEMHGIQNADEPYTICFDETNNIAKLRLNNGKLNVSESACFALGGLAWIGTKPEPLLSDLVSLFGVSSNVPELKRRHLGKGDFASILASEKVKKLFDWLLTQNYYLHYQIVDPLYWGVVDIIDNITLELDIPMEKMFFLSQIAKGDLHRVVQNHLPTSEAIFARFDYPNVSSVNVCDFYNALSDLVKASDSLESFPQKMLLGILEMGMKTKSSGLLWGEDADTLLGSFDKFYAERIILFKNATIIFDNENRISERLKGPAYTAMLGKFKNYQFVDSKNNTHVQLSDLTIGIVGKYFSFLNTQEGHEVAEFLSNLDIIQRQNLTSLKKLIDRSDEQCNAFYHYVISSHLIEKNRQVWRFLS